MSSEIYIGPYIKIPTDQIPLQRPIQFKGCTNPECYKYISHINMSGNYCVECGSKIEHVTIKDAIIHTRVKSAMNYGNLDTDLDQGGPKDRYLFSGVRIPVLLKSSDSKDKWRDGTLESPFAFDINLFDQEKELSWFKEYFAKEFEFLKEKLGADNLTIGWGVIDLLS